jgi:hypothetical protein
LRLRAADLRRDPPEHQAVEVTMKTVKSLLLGGAAGLAAVAGAQAADLPVKAKPVEYVRICSLYGQGFFYIPGTDTCIKIGGWVRFDQYFGNTGGSGSPFNSGATGRNDSFDSFDYGTRARTMLSVDARTQTEYGTLRAYYRGGFELTTNFVSQGEYYTERAFVEFAGFTFGKTQSFFDFAAHAWSYAAGYAGAGPDTAASGRNVMVYTANLGNGVTWTVGAEDATSRRGALWDAGTNSMTIGSFPGPNTWTGAGSQHCAFGSVTSDQNIGNAAAPLAVSGACATGDYAAQSIPDIVSALRVDQSWGSAEINGALHQVRGNFYGNNTQSTIVAGPNAFTGVRPSDVWGWAVLGGLVLNLPWNPGDKFWIEGTYGQGTPCYVGVCQDQYDGNYQRFDGAKVAAAWALDGVFANMVAPAAASPAAGGTSNFSGIILPTNWDITAAVEHYWTPALRTSLFGSFTSWDPGTRGNAVMCASPNGPVRTALGATPNYGTGPVAGCNYAFDLWAVGSRTIWNPVKNLDIGAEVMWMKIHQNMDPSSVLMNFGGGGNRAAGLYVPSDEATVSGLVRVQRNFWP